MPRRKCSSVDQSFGKNLLKYRKLCDYTQQEVADLLNLNRTTYTKYETGVSEPSYDILKKIAAIYGVDINSILGEENFKPKVEDSHIKINNLSMDEKELVGIYRILSGDEKHEFLQHAREIKVKKNNDF